jgi:hypothetical protein
MITENDNNENNSIFSYMKYMLYNCTIYKYKIVINYDITNVHKNKITPARTETNETTKTTENTRQNTKINKTIIQLYDMDKVIKYEEVYGDFTYLDILYYILLKLHYDIYENVYTHLHQKPLQLDFLYKDNAIELFDKMLFYLTQHNATTL